MQDLKIHCLIYFLAFICILRTIYFYFMIFSFNTDYLNRNYIFTNCFVKHNLGDNNCIIFSLCHPDLMYLKENKFMLDSYCANN